MRILIATVAVFSLFLTGCSQPADAEASSAPPEKQLAVTSLRATRVETAHVARSKASLQVKLPGEVEGSREARLASPMGGYIEKVLLREGDAVKGGEAIAWVDRSVHDAQLEAAQARLDQANNDVALTQRAGKSLSQSRRDAAKFNAQAAAASHRLASIQASRARVRAPFDGVIARSSIEQGEVLPPGGMIARVVQLDPIHVAATVSDRDIVSLAKGMPARITTDASARVFEGTLASISPAADINTRAFEIDIAVDNAEHRLLPGMIARVQIDVQSDEDAWILPQYLLVTRREGNGVFVVEEGIARWRPLELGRVVRNQVVVSGGLVGDEEIVVTGHRELVDGDQLTVMRSGQCCTEGRVVFAAE